MKHALLTGLIILVTMQSNAQQQWFGLGSTSENTNIVLTGSYRVLGQTSNRQGTFQQKPPDFARAEFTPTLIMFGIPISATVLYSTEQGSVRQDINAYSINIDPESLLRIVQQRAYHALDAFLVSDSGQVLRDLQAIRDSVGSIGEGASQRLRDFDKLQSLRNNPTTSISDYTSALSDLGLLSSVENIMLYMPKIGVGTVFPTLTSLTLSGSRIQGFNVEWNPGDVFYVNFVKGTTQRPLVRSDGLRIDTNLYTLQDNTDYGRQLIGGRIGFGSRDGAHLMFTGVYTTDDPATVPGSDTMVSNPAQRNILSSMDFRIEPIPGVWTIDGEVAGSITVGDLQAAKISTDALPAFLLDLIDSSSAAYADWSATAGTMLNIAGTGTRLSANVRRIGTGYRALGVPNMRVDVMRYDARIDQAFARRQLTVGVFTRRDQDNLVPVKRATTMTTSMGATLGLSIRKLPYVRASYMPYVQEANTTDSLYAYQHRTTMWNVSSGYSYRLGSISANTQLTYSRQASVSSQQGSDFAVTSANAYQSVSFVMPLTLSMGFGIIEQSGEGASTSIITGDIAGTYALDDVLSASGGLTLALDSFYGDRIGYSLGVTARIENVADIDLRAERSIFDERLVPAVLGGSYAEGIVRLMISKSW